MPKVLKRYTADEAEQLLAQPTGAGRRLDLSEYMEIIKELDEAHPYITVELDEDEELTKVKTRLQQAAKRMGKGLGFRRADPMARELTFRLRTEEENQKLIERGNVAAAKLKEYRADGTLGQRGRKKARS